MDAETDSGLRSLDLSDIGTSKDLSQLGTVRSFEYEVRFEDASPRGDASPLYRSPLFESIWFTFQRKGRTPSWSGFRLAPE